MDYSSSKMIDKPVEDAKLDFFCKSVEEPTKQEVRDRSVYRLLYPITTDRWPALTPFYIGKGTNKRPEDHIRLAKIRLSDADFERQGNKEKNLFKLRVIRKIIKTGYVPLVEYPYTGLTIEEANAIEVSEIARIGRFDLGLGPLTNLTNGGEGTRGFKRPEHVKQRDREREADPDKKQLQRIQSRAFMRFPEIKEKQRINQAAALARPEFKAKMEIINKDRIDRGKLKRDLMTPRVMELYTRKISAQWIASSLELRVGMVRQIIKENTSRKDKDKYDLALSQIVELYNSGFTITKICANLGICHEVVSRVLKENNVQVEQGRRLKKLL